MVSKTINTVGGRILSAAYAVLFVGVLLFFAMIVSEIYVSPARFKDYPWGSETGWNYVTPEVYMASARLISFIALQSMVISAIFYLRRRDDLRNLATAVAALVIFFVFIFFGLPPSGKD
ncbi:MAG TPA: hypothetical protein VEF76_07105 [Patescibacteria group bacterium]|nr:hypothetical protein [Patescibacteria group bacterium]